MVEVLPGENGQVSVTGVLLQLIFHCCHPAESLRHLSDCPNENLILQAYAFCIRRARFVPVEKSCIRAINPREYSEKGLKVNEIPDTRTIHSHH